MKDVFGKVYLDAYHADHPVYYAIERDDDYLSISDANIYFADYDQFSAYEKEAIQQCQGKTVELAAGAGRISLYLQQQGVDVTATDISPKAIEVCQLRGINQTKVCSIFDLSIDEIDTLLIFGNSIPLAADQKQLVALLDQFYEQTTDDGQVFGDFRSPLPTKDPIHLAYHQQNRDRQLPVGRMRFRLRYQNLVGDWIDFWMYTKEEFEQAVRQTDWQIETTGETQIGFRLDKR